MINNIKVWIDELEAESASECACCGRPLHEGEGTLVSSEGEHAFFGYRWVEGHESRFTMGVVAVELNGDIRPGMAAVSCRSDGVSLIYTVLDPEDAPWGDSQLLGPILTRKEIIEDEAFPDLFTLVDAIAANDRRISARILSDIDDQ